MPAWNRDRCPLPVLGFQAKSAGAWNFGFRIADFGVFFFNPHTAIRIQFRRLARAME
jgi:hypothetical protein